MYHTHTHCCCDGRDCNQSVIIASTGAYVPKALREIGWAVARDRQTIYCPSCKQYYTYVGRNGGRKLNKDNTYK